MKKNDKEELEDFDYEVDFDYEEDCDDEEDERGVDGFKRALDIAAKKGMAVGYDEGYDEGYDKGVRKTNLLCAKRMFKLGIEMSIIEEVTEIPVDELAVMFK